MALAAGQILISWQQEQATHRKVQRVVKTYTRRNGTGISVGEYGYVDNGGTHTGNANNTTRKAYNRTLYERYHDGGDKEVQT